MAAAAVALAGTAVVSGAVLLGPTGLYPDGTRGATLLGLDRSDVTVRLPDTGSSRTLVCPDLGAAGRVPVRIDAARPPGPDGWAVASTGAGPGAGAGGRILDDGRLSDHLDLPASAGTADLGGPAAGPPVLLRAPAAAGLSATVTAPGADAGPVRARCAPTQGRTWFAGPATVAGHDPLALWANLGGTPARITVTVLAPGRAPARDEVTVPVGATIARRLATIAPEAPATVVGVSVRAGRVLSWLVDRPSDSPAATISPVPPSADPGRSVLLGGLIVPPGPGPALGGLVVAAPAGDTTVRVRLASAVSGLESLIGLDAVTIPGGEARTIPVGLPRGEPLAVLVDATGSAPVVAGLALAGPHGPVWAAGAPVPAPVRAGATGPAAAGAAGGRGATAGPAGSADSARVAGSAAAAGTARVPDAARSTADADADEGASIAPKEYLVVAPVPPRAAGALLVTAPVGTATVEVDGRRLVVPAGHTAAVALSGGYLGGHLFADSGRVIATQLLGTDLGSSADAAEPAAPPGTPGGSSAPASGRSAQLATVSSVLRLVPAETSGLPSVLLADPAAASAR